MSTSSPLPESETSETGSSSSTPLTSVPSPGLFRAKDATFEQLQKARAAHQAQLRAIDWELGVRKEQEVRKLLAKAVVDENLEFTVTRNANHSGLTQVHLTVTDKWMKKHGVF